jgi:hypothetical protein
MKIYKKIAVILFVFSVSFNVMSGQSDSSKVELSVGADVVNHYVWRGLMLGNGPAVQPSMSVTCGGLSFGSWASYSLNPSSFQEVDLFLTYTAGSVTFGINNYYNPVDSIGVSDTYFDFGKKSTLHSFELFSTWSEMFGSKFSATGAVFFYGNDRDGAGKNLYSSYVELSYSTAVNDLGLDFFAGATLNKGYYNPDGAAFVNLGTKISKEIKVTDNFTVPCSGSFILNPVSQKAYLVIGFTF